MDEYLRHVANWGIMEDFWVLKTQRIWSDFCKVLVTKFVVSFCPNLPHLHYLFLFSVYPPWLYIVRKNWLWNTTECFRCFEDMKDEISSSLKASDILGLIFYCMCYFWVEKLSNLCQLIVCGIQTLRSIQQIQWFSKHRPTQSCIHSWEISR